MTGRRHARSVDAIASGPDGDPPRWTITSPGVGWFRPATAAGHLVDAGDELGTLEVLGARVRVVAPRARGLVVGPIGADGRPALAPRGVGYGDVLVVLDPALAGAAGLAADDGAGASGAAGAGGLVLPAPSSGRYYGRPGPGKPPFVAVGDVIEEGHTVCLLEVMKTFNRVVYGGANLPPRARVTAILVAEDSDVEPGTALLRIEPA